MKKLLSVFTMVIVAATLFSGCASKTQKPVEGKKIPHPRDYVLDPADITPSLELFYNSYGPNYIGTVNAWKFYKKDKPLVEDTVTVNAKITSNIDIPCFVYYLVDTSRAANFGTVLSKYYYVQDVKAGTPFTIKTDIELEKSSIGGFDLVFSYDGKESGLDNFPKIGKAATFKFEKIDDTTDTVAEAGIVPPEGPQILNVQLERYTAFLEIATTHPVVNGSVDMSVVANYQAVPDITGALGDYLPRAGDTLNVTWHAVSDVDIKQVYVRPVDCSAAANWWKELIDVDWDNLEQYAICKDVKAGNPFHGSVTFNITKDAMDQISLCIWYDVGDANPDGPALCKLARY